MNFKLICIINTIVVVVTVFLVTCEAQLNFSPGWGPGKRSGLQDGPCKPSDALMHIYRLVQM
ncbi:Hypertrehalosaemic prohormone [Blattella germanica]|nr:Hypertrehalosaemic prohormone [Blattella germanica]